MRLVLLPGMDGTGALFAPFRAAAPAHAEVASLPLPPTLSAYPDLVRALGSAVERPAETIVIAESFSGPLAISLAARWKPRALVLVNSFVRAPLPAWCCRLAPATLFRVPAPEAALRHWLVGPAATPGLLELLRATLQQVRSSVLAARVRALGALDAREALSRVRCPVLYLRGTADRLVSERSVAEVQACAPQATVVRVPGPHLLLQAAPAAAWAALAPALSRHAAG